MWKWILGAGIAAMLIYIEHTTKMISTGLASMAGGVSGIVAAPFAGLGAGLMALGKPFYEFARITGWTEVFAATKTQTQKAQFGHQMLTIQGVQVCKGSPTWLQLQSASVIARE